MEKVSIIFPVYREGKVVENIIKLQNDPYPNKEFIVTVDCPTDDFLKELDKIKGLDNVKVILSKERGGKVLATNEAVKESSGDILIFLDGDVDIKKFDIKKVVEACRQYDLVEFVKTVKPIGILGKLMHIEYFVYYHVVLWLSSLINKSVAMNGAGFAIRKDIWEKLGGYKRMVVEDVDLATRVYIMGGKYKLLEDIVLEIEPLTSWKKWIDQRKRWAYGGIEWLFTYFKAIFRFLYKNPIMLVTSTILMNPGIIVLLILLFYPMKELYNISYKTIIILSETISPLIFFLIPVSLIYSFVKAIVHIALYILVVTIVYYLFAYKHKVKLNPLWIIGFALIYSPLYILIILYVIFHYILFDAPPKFSWKV